MTMKTRLLKKLRKRARNRISLRPVYGNKIGIYKWDDDEWYSLSLYGSSPVDFERLEDALPELQELREDYVRKAVARMRSIQMRNELEKY